MLILSIFSISYAQNANRPMSAVARPAGSPKPMAMATPMQLSVIKGRVYYEDTGRPVKRTTIMFANSASGPGEVSGMTDGDGNFTVKNVRAGTYYAIVNAPGVVTPISYVDLSKVGPHGNGAEKDELDQAFVNFDKIIVDGVNEVYVQIPAKRGAAVSGRVMYANGDPAIGVKIEVLRKVDGKYVGVMPNLSSIFALMGAGGSQTDDRGMYRFAGLPDGEFVVKVSESAQHADSDENQYGPMGMGMSFLMLGASPLLNFYYPNVTDVKEAQPLNLLLGQEQSEINIVIPDNRLFNLSGKVISQKDKKPLAGAKLFLQKKNADLSLFSLMGAELNAATTDAEGNWRFKEIPKGEYSIKVDVSRLNANYSHDDDDYPDGPSDNSNTVKLPPKKFAVGFKETEVDDKDVSDVIIEVGYGATVAGTISVEGNKDMPQSVSIQAFNNTANDTAKEPVAMASLWNDKYGYSGASNANVARVPSKINNEFKLEGVTAGKITIKFTAGDSKYYVKSAKLGMTDLLAGPLELKEGESLSGAKIVFANDAGTLRGRVLDDKDHAAPGLAIVIVPTDDAKRRSGNFTRTLHTDADGVFEIKLAPAEYYVVFAKAGISSGDQTQFNSWLEDAVRNGEKVSISPEGTSNMSLRKPSE
jgi:Carboxypeptidase regulatory-like domain